MSMRTFSFAIAVIIGFINKRNLLKLLSVKTIRDCQFAFIMWDYEAIGNEVALKMLLVNGVKEPTLAQIHKDTEISVQASGKSEFKPAWSFYCDSHPGIPQHYLTMSSTNDSQLFYSVINREIEYKMIIQLKNDKKKQIPDLTRIINGTIIVTGHRISGEIESKSEIFLLLNDKLIPCLYTTQLENIIIENPSSSLSPVRCYYLWVEDAITEVTFLTSKTSVIHRCDYDEKWFDGSTSYQQIYDLLKTV